MSAVIQMLPANKKAPREEAKEEKTSAEMFEEIQKSIKDMAENHSEDMQGIKIRLNTVESRTRQQPRVVTDEQVKDAVNDAINEGAEEVKDAIKESMSYRFFHKLGKGMKTVASELKPAVPNHDHVKGGVVTVGGIVLTARYAPVVGPVVREAIINIVTP